MKNDYSEKKKKRLEQKIKLLINRPAFQKDITNFRKKWKIPLDGIKNEDDNQNWNLHLTIISNKYYSKNWLKERAEILKLRSNGKFEVANEIRKKINAQAPLSILNDNIWSIVKKYRLSPRWYGGIRRYLLFNDPKNMKIPLGINVAMNWENGIRHVSLEIEEDTTLDDLREVWSWARKMYRGKQGDKFQPIKNFERDKRAYELEQEGRTLTDIADTINLEFNDSMDYNQLRIAIKRYKKHLNINQA